MPRPTPTKPAAAPSAQRPCQGRIRMHYGYSRNGCARCKQLRVRCDEQHPACGRCVRVGVQCPGYEQKLRWSAKHEVFRAPTSKPAKQAVPASSKKSMERLPSSSGAYSPKSLDVLGTANAPSTSTGDSCPMGPRMMSDTELDDSQQSLPQNLTQNPTWTDLFDQLGPPVAPYPSFYLGPAPDLPTIPEQTRDCVSTASPAASNTLAVEWTDPLLSAAGAASNPLGLTTNTQPPADDDVEYIPRDNTCNQETPQHYAMCVGDGPFSDAHATSTTLQVMAPQPTTYMPLMTTFNDFSTVLVEFYFKVTAQIYSCYDGNMNPFRTAVTRMWGSSKLIYCTLQSMAAASLLRDFPQMAPIGRQLRQEADELLSLATVWDTNVLFAVLMLGGTAGWHNPRDLGLPYFNRMAAYIASTPHSAFGGETDKFNYRFFRDSMLFWEMIMAFVTDSDTIFTIPEEPPHAGPAPMPGRLSPHPWTGFGAETQRAMLEVGRLVRRQRKYDKASRFTSAAYIEQLKRDIETAQELEQRLRNISLPSPHVVKDTEDRNSPVWHLLTLAEIVRDTGLVQLYHVFPDLLSARLRQEKQDGDSGLAGLSGQAATAEVSEECANWLCSYTLCSLERMKAIPAESGTRDFQPFLLVALSSELRTSAGTPFHTLFNLDMDTVEVTRARGFIQSRLTAFLHSLPPRPIEACLDIVKETWAQMDLQAERRWRYGLGIAEDAANVYWMDVMIENGWETIMA